MIRVVLPHTLEDTNRKIREVEARKMRADTMEAALHDEYVLQELNAHRNKLAAQ